MLYAKNQPGDKRSGLSELLAGLFLILLFFLALRLNGADETWSLKPPSQWTAVDAERILSASPWAKQLQADIARRETEDQLREGGELGQPTGLGYDGVDPKGSGYKPSWNVFTGKGGDDHSIRSAPRLAALTVGVRWESALPVRLAKLKYTGPELAPLDGEGYQIAVFGVPDPSTAKGDPGKLGEPLRKEAVLRRNGKKDIHPARVEVFRREGGPVIFYLFPPTAEITEKDGAVLFEAHIGRIVISEGFELTRMKFLGKLEL